MKKREKTGFRYETVPVSGGFMLASIFGFLIVTIYTVSGRLDLTWGFTFDLIFVIMFIASLVSITPTLPKELKKR